jgi:hypothetical protein
MNNLDLGDDQRSLNLKDSDEETYVDSMMRVSFSFLRVSIVALKLLGCCLY